MSRYSNYDSEVQSARKIGLIAADIFIPLMMIVGYWAYSLFRIDVPAKHIAVLTKLSGKNIDNDEEIAPDASYKGVQKEVLAEGRYFYNPYFWTWDIYPMVEIPEGKMGVRVRLHGETLKYGDFVAFEENQKGIVKDVLRPGRYPINAILKEKDQILTPRTKSNFAEIVEIHTPVTIPAGFKGIVTNLAGPIPENPNTLLVDDGNRGAQKETLEPGTYYMNPYMYEIIPIDCRSQRFNLAESDDMGFPSKDGFWVSLDGIIEFRVKPEKAAEIYVLYNENNDANPKLNKDIIRKIIMPNARSFCRLRGSNNSGREFIGGETRTKFQSEFFDAMEKACEPHGIEIVQALITKINPPQAIAGPVRDREIAHQKMLQFKEQTAQQEQEALLATEKALINQKKELVSAEQKVVKKTTKAMEDQKVAVTKAEQEFAVSEKDLLAATNQAAAIVSRKKAEAGIIEYSNEAEAAGWKQAVEAMGNGDEYARYVLYQKLAPGFKSILSNTANSPLMEAFRNFQKSTPEK